MGYDSRYPACCGSTLFELFQNTVQEAFKRIRYKFIQFFNETRSGILIKVVMYQSNVVACIDAAVSNIRLCSSHSSSFFKSNNT